MRALAGSCGLGRRQTGELSIGRPAHAQERFLAALGLDKRRCAGKAERGGHEDAGDTEQEEQHLGVDGVLAAFGEHLGRVVGYNNGKPGLSTKSFLKPARPEFRLAGIRRKGGMIDSHVGFETGGGKLVRSRIEGRQATLLRPGAQYWQ